MNFLLLCIQSFVCVTCVTVVKRVGIISFRKFDIQDAKAWYPISLLLVGVIYTGSKSLVSLCTSNQVQVPLTLIAFSLIAIPDYTSVYHLQEFDDHSNC